jgi:hypothetical protein
MQFHANHVSYPLRLRRRLPLSLEADEEADDPIVREVNATQKEMPNVLFVAGLDVAQIVIQIFKLSLDEKVSSLSSIVRITIF